ncbi:MAG TPA: DUF92 domain-containing protein [Terriglobales bacterium]|nr:DUF92 domain-containing protein [Terriglobales bacterium]
MGKHTISSVHQFGIAAAVTVAFAALARWLRGVSRSGALAGAGVCFLLYAGAGPGAFAALVSVFVLAWTTTRWGYKRKQAQGIAEKRDGRTAQQVLANLGVAAVCAGLRRLGAGQTFLLAAMAAALSEAAADTVSSEVGQAFSTNARLITSWRTVPSGSDGGVTALGTLAGILAAFLVSLICVLTGLLPWRWLPLCAGAAVAGTMADSIMGAALQRRGLLSNDLVNFLSTLIAAALACGLASI